MCMKYDVTGKSSWKVRQRAAMLSYAYDEVAVMRAEGKTVIICQGTRKLADGRGG